MRIKREKKKPTNKYERHMLRQQKLEAALTGTGRYLFQNNTSGDLTLPKVAEYGVKIVSKNGTFIGDSYFINALKNDIKILKNLEEIVQTPVNKLITEQPPVITDKGTVEFVEPKKKKKIQESEEKKDILLTEDPEGGVVIID